MSRQKKALLAGLCAAVAALLIGGLLFGWDSGALLIAGGCGLGAYLGGQWGNQKAKETDAYREEWLGKRKNAAQPNQPEE
ncbi:hypothetical protein BJ994_002405 [Arthrobacter pigmenti]|uniref:Uncharacterized protein n=1 Tax=Arthrobacter pigmenti TaxID=271432 RepID=A0A846RQH0_9MICC|nr:hypothetical protein [Arthrobacter pigmenti]NJC23329.1 hypothetical protein [Arthrobacter pigmenti]